MVYVFERLNPAEKSYELMKRIYKPRYVHITKLHSEYVPKKGG